jgi:hypothetical protein
MRQRFTKSEVELARRIKAKVDTENWKAACELRELPVKEMMQRILDAPLQPSYGPTPPWWDQAVAEADQDMLWVNGGGWMPRSLWEDLLAVSADMSELEKECDDE